MEIANNFKYLGNGFYEVYTQAGFNQAIKHCFGHKLEVDDYPKKYPEIICMTLGYKGSLFAQVRILPKSISR